MRILFFCRLFYPHIGGVEKHVMEVSQKLIKEGHHVTVVTEKYISELQTQEKVHGIDIYRINSGKEDRFKKFHIWNEIGKLRSLIQQADIIHCHDVFFWYLPFRFLYPTKPVYTTFHGYESYPISKKAILIRKISEKLSWGNICIGDFIKKWYHTKPTFVSYGAVDIQTNNKKNVIKNGFKKGSAVFMGRLDEQTGVLTYAKSIDLLKKKYPKFVFDIIGDGKDRQFIEKKYKVLGFKKDPERYFQDYHFAFVSRYLSILEAFAARKLVFAVYDNPVKEDYLKMAPYAKFIVIEKDPEKLSEKIECYLHHSKAEQLMIEQGYSWVSQQTWENLIMLYKKLWWKHLT